MSSKKLRVRDYWGTTVSVGVRFYDSMAEEELLAEGLEPGTAFVGGKRSRDEPPVVQKLSKADTCDPSFEQIPENVDREKFLCMMAEMLI